MITNYSFAVTVEKFPKSPQPTVAQYSSMLGEHMQHKQGVTRNVFLIGRYAVKVPRVCSWGCFLNGLLANLNERVFGMMHSPLAAEVL